MMKAEDKRNATRANNIMLEQIKDMEKERQSREIASFLFSRCEKAIEKETTKYETYVEVERNWTLKGFTRAEQDAIIVRAVEITKKMVIEYGYDVTVITYTTIPPIARIFISW